MPAPETLLAGIMLVALTIYALGAGADFGGGVWDLLATGPTRDRQRETIAHAMGPIWEANHVWLILVVVLLFAAFPPAFATIGTALHVPLTLMLIGIVLRGSAFTFRSFHGPDEPVQRRWGRTFAIASVITPIMLGVCVGAVASGRLSMNPVTRAPVEGFFATWLAPFPLAIGAFTLALFAFLAAVYLTLETTDEALRNAFRARALAAALVVGVLALVAFLLSGTGARLIREGLAQRWWSMPFQLATGAMAVGAIVALWTRRYRAARVFAILQVTLILWGWGLAQYPYLIEPDLTIAAAASPPRVLRAVLWALAAGSVLLIPALIYLFRLFKSSRAQSGSVS
jgi:cytochrome bd ubiquinol oxidase subunit II